MLDGETLITLEIQFSGFEADNSSTQQIGSRVRRKSPSGEQQVPPPERPHSEAIVEQNSQIPQDMLNAGSNCQRFGSEANMESNSQENANIQDVDSDSEGTSSQSEYGVTGETPFYI